MTHQGNVAILTSRGHRLNQPSQEREHRKPPQSNMVIMCDGTEVSQRKFDHFKLHGPQKLRERYAGCAQKLRKAIPRQQWSAIDAWIESRRPESAVFHPREEDHLVAILLAYAADKIQQNTGCLFDEIIETRSAHQLLLPTSGFRAQ